MPVAQAIARLLGWFETMRIEEGYGGPVVGLRANCLRFCGPATDWRLEGILDSHIALHSVVPSDQWLDALEKIIASIVVAQREDGFFDNSYFEHNPFEGGMPHEPAVLSACLRAQRLLAEQDRFVPGLNESVRRYIDEVITLRLWNKSLRFVRDWEISDFQYANVQTCAAALGLILEWCADQPDDWSRLESYAAGCAEKLLAMQSQSGHLAGGIPSSTRRGAGTSPFYAARALRPLQEYAEKTDDAAAGQGAQKLREFLVKQALPSGGFRRLLWSWRPSSINPLVTGASAYITAELATASGAARSSKSASDAVPDALVSQQLTRLLDLQTPSGAFRHAIGYGRLRPSLDHSDWRDWIAATGWQDKILRLLCLRLAASKPTELAPIKPAPPQEFETETHVTGQKGLLRETSDELTIERAGEVVYQWRKGNRVPAICHLS